MISENLMWKKYKQYKIAGFTKATWTYKLVVGISDAILLLLQRLTVINLHQNWQIANFFQLNTLVQSEKTHHFPVKCVQKIPMKSVVFYQSFFQWNLPLNFCKFPPKSAFFLRICLWKACEIWFFSPDLPEALLRKTLLERRYHLRLKWPAWIATDVTYPTATSLHIDKRCVHKVQYMDVNWMLLWLKTVSANVKALTGGAVVGECLPETVTCAFTNSASPNSTPILIKQPACFHILQRVSMCCSAVLKLHVHAWIAQVKRA